MTTAVNKDLVQTTLATPVGTTDTSLTVNTATAPFLNIPNPGTGGIGYLVLADSLNNPTKIEIVSYTAYSSGTVSGVTRALGGTTAQSFAANAVVYMAPLSLNTAVPIWAINLANGNVSYVNGNVGIGTATPDSKLHVVGATHLQGTAHVTGDVTADGNVDVAGDVVATGNVSAATVEADTANIAGNVTVAGIEFSGPGTTITVYKAGSWTPVLIGSSAAGTGSYTTGTGTYITIGQIMLLQFSITVAWPSSAPAGDLIISGYPSIGTNAGFVGEFSKVSGLQGFKGLTVSDTGQPVFNSVSFKPVTINEGTNKGIKITRQVYTHDENATPKDSSSNVAAVDATYIIDSTVGVTLNGSIMIFMQEEDIV